jgi:hypothetical protein
VADLIELPGPVAPPEANAAGVAERRLRIGLFRRYLSPEPGGVQRYFWEFTSWLAARGHEVHVFTQIAGDPPGGAALHVVPRLESPEVVRLVTDLRLDVLSTDPERIRPTEGLRFNVLRPGFGAAGVIANGTLSRSAMLRGLYRVWRMIVPRGWRVGRERWWLSRTDPAPLVVANSAMVRRNLREQYGIPDDRIHIVLKCVV